MALEMCGRERCGALPRSGEAHICGYEFSFCPVRSEALRATCPNYAGELVRRGCRPAGG